MALICVGVFPWKFPLLFLIVRWFWDAFQCRFISFWVNPRNFNPRKIQFSDSFWYKTIFAQSGSMIAYWQSDVEFYGESYGAQNVTGFYWVQKCYMKNLEKVEKIMNIQEYSTKFQHFLRICFTDLFLVLTLELWWNWLRANVKAFLQIKGHKDCQLW